MQNRENLLEWWGVAAALVSFPEAQGLACSVPASLARRRSGKLGVDFARFDCTQLRGGGSMGNLGSASTSGVYPSQAGQVRAPQQQEQQPEAAPMHLQPHTSNDYGSFAGAWEGAAEADEREVADFARAHPIPSPFSSLLNGQI